MTILGISTLLLGILSLLFTVYVHRKHNPRLEVIRLYRYTTQQFTKYINDLEVSYKGQVFPELSAIEFIIANKSYRSIEGEDISNETPIEIFLDSPAVIHDFHVIKKVGESRVELVRIDENTIRVNISSMDKGSSLRVKMLCSEKEPILKARGRLLKANYSVSKITDLKGTNISDLIRTLLDGAKRLFLVSIILGAVAGTIAFLIDFTDTPEEARILPPEDFFALSNQLLVIDSLIEDSNTAGIKLIHETKNGEIDSFNINLVKSDWIMSWWGGNDKCADWIADSLESEGYIVEYSTIIDLEFHSRYGFEKIENKRYPQFTILVKEHNTGYYFAIIKLFLLVFFFTALGAFVEITLMNWKNIYRAFTYKDFLSESEVKEIKEQYKGTFISGLFVKLL